MENYQKAIQIYEQVASASLDNSLLKYSAKEYFFRAALCHLCIDLLNAQHAVQQYENMYPAFQVCIKLLKDMVNINFMFWEVCIIKVHRNEIFPLNPLILKLPF